MKHTNERKGMMTLEQQTPLISVIVPIYNVEKYLRKCVDSILDQAYPNIEIILVDDGSTDSCPQICEEYKEKYDRVIVIHKENGGSSTARNAGISAAKGEYIGFVDSDDYVSRDMYANLYKAIAGQRDCIACTGYVEVNDNGEPVKDPDVRATEPSQTAEEYCRDLLLHNASSSVWSKLFHKSFFSGIRFIEGRINEDVLMMFHALSQHSFSQIVFTGKFDYFYLTRQGSLSRHFGKAIYDAVTNAHEIRQIVDEQFPDLRVYAERFELYQNMVFLRHCPYNYKCRTDATCVQVQRFVRKNFFAAWKNPCLRMKEKLIFTALCVIPRTVSFLIEKKNNRSGA